jgi:hypothetical protein
MGVRMISRFLARCALLALLFLSPIGATSRGETLALTVVGVILARTIGHDSYLAVVLVPFAIVYVFGLLRLAWDAAAGRKGA